MSNSLLNLIVQPADVGTRVYLGQLGFQPVPTIPQLLYQTLADSQTEKLLSQMAALSDCSQQASRFVVTRLHQESSCLWNSESSLESDLDSRQILLEFLNAQPLSQITTRFKYRWFLDRLETQQFFFKYQPIFDLKSCRAIGHECLLRTISETGECLSGHQILQAALATQLTEELDRVARELCIASLANFGSKQTFFINVLPNALLTNPQSIERNLQQILDLGLQPEQIVFELTELETLKDGPALAKTIKQLQAWGLKVAIDDLCGNVSADHYFMEFQPDIIKLDRQLVNRCSYYSMKRVLIKSLLACAHELDILVIAEGLEDEADIQCCQDLGVDCGQGFGLGMPQLLPQNLATNSKICDRQSLLDFKF